MEILGANETDGFAQLDALALLVHRRCWFGMSDCHYSGNIGFLQRLLYLKLF